MKEHSEVFISEFSVLGIVQNGKLGVENLGKLILRGFRVFRELRVFDLAPKVKHSTLIADCKEEGHKDVDGTKINFHFNFKLSKQCCLQGKNLPRFYNALVRTWSDVSENDPKEVLEISSEVLWNNLNISSKGESLYNQHLIDKGVVTVGNTFSNKGEILTWEEAKRKYSLSSHNVLN